jgi:hypothetical protein
MTLVSQDLINQTKTASFLIQNTDQWESIFQLDISIFQQTICLSPAQSQNCTLQVIFTTQSSNIFNLSFQIDFTFYNASGNQYFIYPSNFPFDQ